MVNIVHRYFKTNSALGYRQYAYLLKLDENKYLCCNSPYNSFYETGSVLDDLEYIDLELVQEQEFSANSCIHKDLIKHLVQG